MSPLQGRWMVEVTFQFVGPRPYASLYCPFRASITLKGFNNLAQGLAPGNQSDHSYPNSSSSVATRCTLPLYIFCFRP